MSFLVIAKKFQTKVVLVIRKASTKNYKNKLTSVNFRITPPPTLFWKKMKTKFGLREAFIKKKK